jgi:riboflavin kinase/FMN adenylyltransferase
MTVLHRLQDLAQFTEPVVLAFGVFDGVHLGHQAVLKSAATLADGALVVVFTFHPHPARLLRPESAPKLLCSPPHELELLRRTGVNAVLRCPFDLALAQLEAEVFLEQIRQHCPTLKGMCVGEDWRFGKGRTGDVALLKDWGQRYGIVIHGVAQFAVGGEAVSSTRIRQAVSGGDLAEAARLLGRPYGVFGTVVAGRQLARTLGFPTANLAVENEQLPPAGVYVVQVRLADQSLVRGVANLGRRPTVTPDEQELNLEVHLLDFSADLYGHALEVEFLHRLRDEQTFPGLDALKAQIAADVEATQLWWTQHPT